MPPKIFFINYPRWNVRTATPTFDGGFLILFIMDSFIKQLTSSSFWTLNKDLCRTIGLQNTLVLQHFIDLQYKLFGGKEFYQQQERIQEELGISERQVKQTIKYLLDEGFISVEKKGIPCKNYYLISEDKITSLVSSIQPNQSGQTDLTREDELTSQRKELIKKEKEKELIKIELIKKELKENKVEELNFGKYNNI